MPAAPPRLTMTTLTGYLLAVGLATWLAGCGTEAAPVTAQSSKFRPAGEVATTAPVVADPAVNEPVRQELTANGPPTNSDPPPTTPPAAADEGDSLAVPEGDAKALSAFIDRLAKMQPKGRTEQEQIGSFVQIQQARLAAAKKLLALNPDRDTKQQAVQAMYEIFLQLSRLGVPGVPAQLKQFATGLAGDSDQELARLGRHTLFNVKVSELAQEPIDDGQVVLGEIQALLEGEAGDVAVDTLELAARGADILHQNGLAADAAKALGLIATAAKGSKDEKIAAVAPLYNDRAKLIGADLNGVVSNVLAGEKDADQALLASVTKILSEVSASTEVFKNLQQVAQFMEMTGHPAVATQVLTAIETKFKDIEDKELAAGVAKSLANARKRLALVGQPFTVEGVLIDGKPFDWNAYAGKVVLVDFWATWCGPCLQEIPNIERNFEEFRPRGFEVVGVNLDTSVEDVKRFFAVQELPWTTVSSQAVVDGTADPEDFGALTMAAKCGVDSIPFLVLVGKDGKVDSLHVRGPKLRSRLVALLGEPAPAEKPASEKPAEEKPATEKPAAEKPAEEKPAEKPAAEKPAAEKPAAGSGVSSVALAVVAAIFGADAPAAPPVAEDISINPYLLKPGLSSSELVQKILAMLDKPKTIQSRPGFTEAVADACDRVLAADPPAKDVDFFIAAESKFSALHKKACTGDDAADKQLVAFVEKMKSDQRPRIARQVAFFQQERKVLDAVDGPVEKIPELLTELKEYFAKEKLEARHLRMASSTVALINKLADGDQRETHFGEFGGTFAKASDKELARYGKKLAKKPEATESDLIGKPLELAGTTAKGANFVWDGYRGKVVLVDFWATWCGPCRREMPNVKALYEKHRDRGFDVVGISLDQDQEALAEYLEENEIAWETLAGDGTQELAGKYGVRGIPTMMLIDKEGKVVGVAHNIAALSPQLEKLLGGAAPAK